MNFKQEKLFNPLEIINDKYIDLLSNYMDSNNIQFDKEKFYDELSKEQNNAFQLFKQGKNILILGVAGSGKSVCIKHIENYVKINSNKKIYICATTGIAAYNIGGMTIHSFLGIGTGEHSINVLINRINKKKQIANRIKNTNILIIDEISMLSAELFEKINIICKVIRKDESFFGGIQVILSGDFFQLLPVFNKNENIYGDLDTRLIIESNEFNKNFKKNDNIIILKENFRQKEDSVFTDLLLRIRDGTFTQNDISILKKRLTLKFNNNILTLVSTNKQAQIINDFNLNKIKEKSVKFSAEFKTTGNNTNLEKILKKELEQQLKQKGIIELELKKGARVMLIKNIDVENGLVNGTLGTIVSFEKDNNYPTVLFDNFNKEKLIEPQSVSLELDECIATVKQIPLMLAYAITHHKSQSLTLDSAVLDLGNCFTEGQVYVALSRLRSLDGLYLKSFDENKIKINEKMNKYMNNF